ncbi:MAG: GlsB/YeaQ/YmgE family stress response membrane protein [Pirellulaceae bacterium]
MESQQLVDFANSSLTWIGFGTVIGLVAKLIMPGRDPGGTIATLMMGIAGTLIGCAIHKLFTPNQNIQPISMQGFAVGVFGAMILLFFYKVLGGHWFTEGEIVTQRHRRRRRRSRTVFDD